MTRHRWRESIKSVFGNHIAPEKSQELEKNKNDIENKVTKILKLIKEEEKEEGPLGNLNKGSELVNLVEDFQKQYQSLYALYDHLTGELRRKAHYKEETDGHFSSTSSSDSESENSKDKASKNRKWESELQKPTGSLKQEPVATNEEKESLRSEHLTALSKIEEAEKTIEDLRIKAERLEDERLKLWVDNGDLNLKLAMASKLEAELDQRLKDINREKESLYTENLTALRRIEKGEKIMEDLRAKTDQLKDEKSQLWVDNGALKLELKTVKGQVSDLKHLLESANQQGADLNQAQGAKLEENNSVASKNSEITNGEDQAHKIIQELMDEAKQLKERLEEKEAEFSALLKIHEDFENEASARNKGLEAQVTDLQLELDSLSTQKREWEEQTDSRTNEAKQLGKEKLRLLLVQTELQDRISELERISNERRDELSTLLKKLEDGENDALTQIKDLTAKVNDLQLELDSLRAKKSELEEQVESKTDEAKWLREENLGLRLVVTEMQDNMPQLERILKERRDEFSVVLKKLEDLVEDKESQASADSAQIEGLVIQVKDLQLELDSTRTQKNRLELQIGRRNKEASENQMNLEIMRCEFTSTIADQQRMLKEQGGLAAHVNNMQLELDSFCTQKKKLEEQIRIKSHEAEQLREENLGLQLVVTDLQDKIPELERISEERHDELFAFLKKLEGSEHQASVYSVQIEGLMIQVNDLQLELNSTHTQKNQLELQIGRRNKEASENQMQMKILKRELASKIADQQRMLKVKEGLVAHVNDLQLELDSLCTQKNKLEEQIRIESHIAEQLREENLGLQQVVTDLQDKIPGLGRISKERHDELFALLKKLEDSESQASVDSAQIEGLMIQVNELQLELDSIHTQKNQLELQIERRNTEALENQMQMETLSCELAGNIADQQRMLKEQEGLAVHVNDLQLELDSMCTQKNKLEVQIEREKREASESQTQVENLYVVLNSKIADQKRMLEEQEDRFKKLSEEYRQLQVKLRVTEQLLKENVDSQQKTEKFQQELEKAMGYLVKELSDKKQQELALQGKVGKLDVGVCMKQGDKERLLRSVAELEQKVVDLEKRMKEKEEMVVGREEEKREAIRQLCLWIDYHRDYCDHLKVMLSKMSKRNRRMT